MTIKELREQLNKYPDHLVVWVDVEDVCRDAVSEYTSREDAVPVYIEIDTTIRAGYDWNNDRVIITLKDEY